MYQHVDNMYQHRSTADHRSTRINKGGPGGLPAAARRQVLRARAALRRRGAEERHLSARSRALRQNGYGKAVLLDFLFVFLFFLFFLSNEQPRYGKVLHGRKKKT